eukprot:761365-Hanusia_phi.AAC.1
MGGEMTQDLAAPSLLDNCAYINTVLALSKVLRSLARNVAAGTLCWLPGPGAGARAPRGPLARPRRLGPPDSVSLAHDY